MTLEDHVMVDLVPQQVFRKYKNTAGAGCELTISRKREKLLIESSKGDVVICLN